MTRVYRNAIIIATILLLLVQTGLARQKRYAKRRPSNQEFVGYYIPKTISEKAQIELQNWDYSLLDMVLPGPNDLKGWKKAQQKIENDFSKINQTVIQEYEPTIDQKQVGDIFVLDIKPFGWRDNGKVLVYVHGGGYTLFSPESTLFSSVPLAQDTGYRVISVGFTLAPFARFNEITDQVIFVIKALLKRGYTSKNIAIYGDSSGAALAAGSVLKMIDNGMETPAAVVLWSPWSDITETGDTYQTLKDADPLLNYDDALSKSAAAYADPNDQKNPYVSPVYGDYSKGFPPTLIQGGTKEIFLSNMVRLYQAMDRAGVIVKLDLYEGMWHDFQAFNYDMPESRLARDKVKVFMETYVKN